ncbi:Retrovirus-related Pol polyprotein from transposon TNT 1-94 [Mycena venus]|uniref:Retrovirus-related Pol polyprotein from transposon TNT 1-94 n=1 Tax=Mycena venus TaxID=2733690 RepID=A0A8H6XT81_9AGAR|nr:Retrovirus-related Pol polyprotein from transposon TNT 1-94 [Mycena venus]
MSTTNSKLSDYFLCIPKCEADGSNWSVYKNRFSYAADAAGLGDHLLLTYTAPITPTVISPATAADAAVLELFEKDLKTYKSGQAIIKQAIASSIPDPLFLRIKDEKTAADLWKKVSEEFEKKSKMVTVDLHCRLQDEHCTETGDVRTHLAKLQTLRTDLIGMGADPGDDNFTAIILGLLPPSYDPYLSAIMATSTLLAKTLSPDDLIRGLNEEADHRSLKNKSRKDNRDIAFSVGDGKGGRGKGGSKPNVECYNCHKKGHIKADCWAKGGGKEGKGPQGKGKGKGKESANAAANKDNDGVWMAQVEANLQSFAAGFEALKQGNGSGTSAQGSAGCWLSDYDDEDFFENEEDGSISDVALLPELQDLLETALGAMGSNASDNSDNFAYWVEISVNEWISNQENKEENITSSFDTAMLASDAGTPNVETELYDLGASRHMSPYRHRFINYTSIPPKSITAADNGSFQAIGQGDMHISIPNGNSMATVLLKGVLYAPKLGFTLISISKITDAGFATLFRDDFCRIFDKKQKLLGVIKKKNSTYRVQHAPTTATSGVTAASAVETVSIEELHRKMGHIAPEARLVSVSLVYRA